MRQWAGLRTYGYMLAPTRLGSGGASWDTHVGGIQLAQKIPQRGPRLFALVTLAAIGFFA